MGGASSEITVRRLAIAALALVLASAAQAESRVLQGVPAFYDVEGPMPGDSRPAAGALGVETLSPDAPRPLLGDQRLAGVPEYAWWYGCSPTSAGMLAGYWAGQPGRQNLFDGDAGQWYGDQDVGTKAMVANRPHITAGRENGYTYGDWHNSASYPHHAANPGCIADFIKTRDGISTADNITTGLKAFTGWDNPATALHEGQPASTADPEVSYYGGNFTYESYKAEIDAGRPVMLNVLTAETTNHWEGHSIVAYGYRDNMFQVKVAVRSGAALELTVGGAAVRDTWSSGTGYGEWVDWNDDVFSSVIDSGVEWWPFVEFEGASWIHDDGTPGPYDWMVMDAVTLYVAPEPATLALVAVGAAAFLCRARRRVRPSRPAAAFQALRIPHLRALVS
jgi:hypothetical protein